jgi:hypothetical protein
VEESSADVCDLIDGCVEGGFVRFRGLVEAADLPDELQGGVADLLVGHGRIEVEEVFDVSAHAGIIGSVCGQVPPPSTKVRKVFDSDTLSLDCECDALSEGVLFRVGFVKYGDKAKTIWNRFSVDQLFGYSVLEYQGLPLCFIQDHGVEAVADEEAGVLVELDGLVVGFRYSEGDGGEAGAGEVVDAVFEEGQAETLSAMGGGDAELGDVGYVVGYAGAQQHSDESSVALIAEDPGRVGIEDAATGEADDVVEEAQGTVQGTVLIVDAGVDVAEVGLVDQLGGCLIVIGGPAYELDIGREGAAATFS